MRCLFTGIAYLVSCALVFAGCMIAFFGFADLNVERNAYRLDVGRSGGDCGGGFVHLDVGTGEELHCGPAGVMRTQKPKTNAMFGFTDEQKDDVYSLARELGRDGLSETDEDQVQALVDKYKATVPPADRFRTADRRWGVPDAWSGAAIIVLGGLGILIVRRTAD
ncbi:hypothetical protein ACGFIF_12550 [Kribbella sp. NPDC049174]|uniref:hypothetical protein n=1 Tax=Kribbella sp. NPDC049174 TaxID=3364112 RepID=UPI003722112E